jgi:hypothetical protein
LLHEIKGLRRKKYKKPPKKVPEQVTVYGSIDVEVNTDDASNYPALKKLETSTSSTQKP